MRHLMITTYKNLFTSFETFLQSITTLTLTTTRTTTTFKLLDCDARSEKCVQFLSGGTIVSVLADTPVLYVTDVYVHVQK